MSATTHATATVRFGRLERRGVLLGRSGPQLLMMALAASIAVVAEYTAGLPWLVAAAPAWAPLLLLGTLSAQGRPLLVWIPIVADHLLRRVSGSTRLRRRPSVATSAGLAVPGVRKPLAVRASSAGAALVDDAGTGTTVAVLQVRGSGFLLADHDQQAAATRGWAQLLASLTQSRAVARIQVQHATSPAVDGEVRRWWADQTGSAASGLPARLVADLLADADLTATHVTCLIAVAFDRRSIDRSAGAPDAALASFADAAAAAGLTVQGWLTPRQLARAVRRAYDPTTPATAHRSAPSARPSIAAEGWDAGTAMALDEAWSHLRTDTAVHTTYWISEWPRADVAVDFLQPLLLSPDSSRTFSLIAEPVPLAAAARDIRRARVDLVADSAHRARTGRIEDESARAEADDVAQRERDLVAGHGDLRFTGLLTVTAHDLEALRDACRATEAAAARAMCEIRPLSGQQAAAHTACTLPLARGIL